MSNLIESALAATLLAIQLGMDDEAPDGADAPSGLLPAAPAVPALAAARSTAADLPVKQDAGLGVVVNGAALQATDLEAISEVIVKQDLEAPSSFTLRFDGDDAIAQADRPLYNLGGTVTVSLGYGALSPLITGEITGLEIDLTGGDVPSLTVRGYDLCHRLLRGTRTDSYPQAMDSTIAARIAQRNGLVFGGEATTVVHEIVLQHEQTDLDFLKQRAAAIGYEVVVDGATLYFRPHRLGAAGALTLSMDGDVTEFYARMSAVGQPGEVHVRGWDPKQKQPIDEAAAAADLSGMGGTVGPQVVSGAFPISTVPGRVTEVDRPVFTAEEAREIARGQLAEMALGFICGEGSCTGNPGLKAGTTLALEGLGDRFGGRYYVVAAEHTYTRDESYRTRFTVRRNATQTSSASFAPALPSLS